LERLEEQMRLFNIHSLLNLVVLTGNYNAHHAYPQIDWRKFGGTFVKKTWVYTTLSRPHEHYDHFAAFFDALKESIPLS
jgi:adenylosuccinate lyase